MASSDRTPLYVRLPRAEADRLDRAAFELKTSKQDLVAGLVSRYVRPDSSSSLRELRRLSSASPGFTSTRRETTVEIDDSLTVGRASIMPFEPAEILTLDELAAWLRVDAEPLRELAESGELPGRKLGDEWRFAREAILAWLAKDG